MQNHPALQGFLQDNPGVRDQLKQDPNAFMRQEDRFDRSENGGDRDATHRMADFGGFLGDHSDIQRDLSKNPSVVKDHEYVQNHAALNAYLNAHPDVRDELMANPQSFVKGAQHFSNGSAGTTGGAGVNGSGSGAGTTGSSTALPPIRSRSKTQSQNSNESLTAVWEGQPQRPSHSRLSISRGFAVWSGQQVPG